MNEQREILGISGRNEDLETNRLAYDIARRNHETGPSKKKMSALLSGKQVTDIYVDESRRLIIDQLKALLIKPKLNIQEAIKTLLDFAQACDDRTQIPVGLTNATTKGVGDYIRQTLKERHFVLVKPPYAVIKDYNNPFNWYIEESKDSASSEPGRTGENINFREISRSDINSVLQDVIGVYERLNQLNKDKYPISHTLEYHNNRMVVTDHGAMEIHDAAAAKNVIKYVDTEEAMKIASEEFQRQSEERVNTNRKMFDIDR